MDEQISMNIAVYRFFGALIKNLKSDFRNSKWWIENAEKNPKNPHILIIELVFEGFISIC